MPDRDPTCVKVNPKKPELTEGFMVREIGGSMAPLWSLCFKPYLHLCEGEP